jgi:hypothetical protein
MSDTLKTIIDWGSFSGIIAALMKLVPDISAVVGLCWLLIRIWEMDTVKGWTGRDKKNGNE